VEPWVVVVVVVSARFYQPWYQAFVFKEDVRRPNNQHHPRLHCMFAVAAHHSVEKKYDTYFC
jgi:hypothetical protein